MPRNLGAREREKDPRDILLGSVQAPISIPSSFIPDVSWLQRNYQGQTAFCGEHAGTHLKAILDHAASGSIERKSPRYGAIKLKDPHSPLYDGYPPDGGTTMTAIFKWLQKAGADDFVPLENDVMLPLMTYCDPTAVTPAMDTNAALSKVASYAFGGTDFASICQAIYQNKAVILLIKCDDGFWGTSTPTFTTPLYGHFVVAYGYDATHLYVVDSADPDDAFAFKKIAAQYVTPRFFFEAGTAIDIPPEELRAVITDSATVVQEVTTSNLPTAQKLNFLTIILNFLSLFSPKVGSASPEPMQKIEAYNWSALGQSLLDIGIKAFVFLVLLLLNFISAALSNGTFQLPYPAITLPALTLLVSQLDSYFVNWAQKENVPVPQQ